MPRVLLVEDDAAISDPLARALGREGYEVAVAATGAVALATARTGADLVVLDLGLPDLDGLDVCRQMRHEGLGAPILILTARADEVDTVVGLDAGADDYVTKPFRLAELTARVRALLRRGDGASPAGEVYAARGVRLDVASHQAWRTDEATGEVVELGLAAKEFDLLAALLREAGAVIPRERLMEEVWGPEWFGSTKTLDMHVSWLRRKLGDEPVASRWITTVRGVGFRFERD